MGFWKKVGIFEGSHFQTVAMTSNFDEIKKFKNQYIAVCGGEPTLGSKSLKVGLEVVGFSLSTDSAVQVYK